MTKRFFHPLGLDIGGANLKAASASGEAWSEVFPMWREPQNLATRLRAIIARFPATDAVAVTMTGELADCFATKEEGVVAITNAVEEAAEGRPLRIWTTRGEFVDAASARRSHASVAAANWHALATWAGRLVPTGPAVLLDVGSTTSDLIPIVDGLPCAEGTTDLTRMLAGELVYTGVRRTPVCAIPTTVRIRGVEIHPAAELFATTHDVYLLLNEIPEDESNSDTANGRPATRYWAIDRLARAFCCDRTELTPEEVLDIARQLAAAQRDQLRKPLDRIAARFHGAPVIFITSGSGSFLARQVLTGHPAAGAVSPIALDAYLSPQLAESAPAYAVAVLLAEIETNHNAI